MKPTLILIFYISFLLFGSATTSAQRQSDSLKVQDKYGVRFGADLSKPIRTLIDDDYSGFEIMADLRIYENWYAAAEVGFDEFIYDEVNFEGSTNGSYFKIGGNYNAYENWTGMQNEIYAGVRFGFSSFSQNLDRYEIYSTSPYFPPNIVEANAEYKNLTASWIEFQLGTKVEVLNNLFLGLHLQLKRRMNETRPSNFANLFIPGFHRTYDFSKIGVGYGYSVTYLLPLFKK